MSQLSHYFKKIPDERLLIIGEKGEFWCDRVRFSTASPFIISHNDISYQSKELIEDFKGPLFRGVFIVFGLSKLLSDRIIFEKLLELLDDKAEFFALELLDIDMPISAKHHFHYLISNVDYEILPKKRLIELMKASGLTQIRGDDFTEFSEFLDAISAERMRESVRSDLLNKPSLKNDTLLQSISIEGLELAPVMLFYGNKRPKDNHTISAKNRVEGLKSIENARNKIRHLGVEPLSDEELLALALDVDPDTCGRILRQFGGKALLKERERDDIPKLLKIDEIKAENLIALLELGRRLFRSAKDTQIPLRSPEEAFEYLKDMKSLKREHLRGLYLNPQGTVIWDEVIAIGSLSKALVSAREIIAPALEHNASGIILAHNHLSGIAEPSIEDSEMTLQIENAMELMKIDLWDHIIIADDNYYSFNEAGKLKLKDKKIAFSVRK